MTENQRIAAAAWQIVSDPRSTRIEKLEGLKLIAAAKGLLLPDLDERWLTVKQVCELRRVKQQLTERALKKKIRKSRANRKQYLKRTLKTLEKAQPQAAQQQVEPNGQAATYQQT